MAKEKLEIEISAVDRTGGALGALSVTLGNLASRAIEVGLQAVTGAIQGLGSAVGYALSEAMSAEEIMTQLNAVIASTGGAAGVTADMASQLADSLSQVTRFEDDAILKSQALLLTFTNISSDVFPAATQAILDMSTAMGQDLQTSAIQIGKALNDPIAGMGALQRVGVAFNETQKATIEGLIAGGQTMEAQRLILAELTKEFGGSAVAAGQTFAGQMDIIKNTLSNVAENIGMAVLPTLKQFADQLLTFVQSDQFQQWVETAAAWLRDELPLAIQTVVAFWESDLKPALAEWWPIMKNDILPALMEITRILGVVLPPVVMLSSRMIGFFAGVFDFFMTPLEAAIDGVKRLYDAFVNLKSVAPNLDMSGFANTMAMTNPFSAAGSLISQGVAGAAGGGGATTVNVNAGSVLSFMDESALEAWLRPLIQQWTGR